MDKNNIVINTLVFLDDLNKGVKQSKLLEYIYSSGIKSVEIRREFMDDFDSELLKIRTFSEKFSMVLYYSVSGSLYTNGKLNRGEIERYFKESGKMGCRNVKLNIGDYDYMSTQDVLDVNSICDKYSIKLTIENDQTDANGKIDKIERFLETAKSLGMKVHCTFDIGNWIWQKEDPLENAYKLKPYVTYIHLKDVYIGDKPHVVLLDEGNIPWRNILKIFDGSIPVALEYPCRPDTLSKLENEISKLQKVN
ncbi:MAG: sugar phosphate isomerase/epimerase [Clostridiales bacterium]|nr:sugar phosphate isomerase/epimerase [Clostridiales bacterium]